MEIITNIRQRKLSDIMEEDVMLEQSSTNTASLSFLQNEMDINISSNKHFNEDLMMSTNLRLK